MTEPKHLYSETEDVEDVLKIIEESYNIRFETNELSHVNTFGELCDYIISKINLNDVNDCSNQQAFYKLREAIIISKHTDKSNLHTETLLSSIFPKKGRRKQIAQIESHLGFKLKVLRAKHAIDYSLIILCLGSLIWLFINWKLGLLGFISSLFLLKLSEKTGKEFKIKTLGELAEKMTQENYLKSRRDPSTMNKKEIVKKIEQLFIRALGLESDFKEIAPDTIIIER
jgi:hypothetical protein